MKATIKSTGEEISILPHVYDKVGNRYLITDLDITPWQTYRMEVAKSAWRRY